MITSLTSDKNQTTRSAISSFIILILKSKSGNISLFKKKQKQRRANIVAVDYRNLSIIFMCGLQVHVPQNTTQFSIIHILCHKYTSWTIIGFLERFSL